MADDGGGAIGTALSEAIGAVNGAQVRLAAASQHANGAARRMGTTGFPGIARELAGIKSEIDDARGQLSALAPMIQIQAGAAAAISDRTAPDHALATLDPIVVGIDQAVAACDVVGEALALLEATIRRRLSGGRPQDLLAKISPARAALAAARRHLSAGRTAADAARAEARQAGAASLGRGAGALLPSALAPAKHAVARVGEPIPDPEDLTGDAPVPDALPARRRRRGAVWRRARDTIQADITDVSDLAGQATNLLQSSVRLKVPELRPPAHVDAGTQVSAEPYAPPAAVHSGLLGDTVTNVVLAVYVLIKGGHNLAHLARERRRIRHDR